MYHCSVDAFVRRGVEQPPHALFDHRPDRFENRRTKISSTIMRILIYTHVFPPNVGGVETYARLVSEGLAKRTGTTGTEKIEVTVVTNTPAESGYDAKFPFPVVRQPGRFRLLKLIRSASIVQLAGPSLLPMVFAFLLQKPFIIEHHGY